MTTVELIKAYGELVLLLVGIVALPLGAYRAWLDLKSRDKANCEKIEKLEKDYTNLDAHVTILERDTLLVTRDMKGIQDSFDAVLKSLSDLNKKQDLLLEGQNKSDKDFGGRLSKIEGKLEARRVGD